MPAGNKVPAEVFSSARKNSGSRGGEHEDVCLLGFRTV
jgi:hypothetical protein